MKRKYLYLLIFIQLGIIISMYVYQSLPSRIGIPVQLKASTYDPRDVLKGDYVVLTYDIGWAPIDKWKGSELYTKETLITETKKVYVILKKGKDNYGEIDYITDKKPHKEELYVKAKLQGIEPSIDKGSGLILQYGIEEYYVKEGTGLKYEGKPELVVDVYIWDGNVVISRVSY